MKKRVDEATKLAGKVPQGGLALPKSAQKGCGTMACAQQRAARVEPWLNRAGISCWASGFKKNIFLDVLHLFVLSFVFMCARA